MLAQSEAECHAKTIQDCISLPYKNMYQAATLRRCDAATLLVHLLAIRPVQRLLALTANYFKTQHLVELKLLLLLSLAISGTKINSEENQTTCKDNETVHQCLYIM